MGAIVIQKYNTADPEAEPSDSQSEGDIDFYGGTVGDS